MKHRTNYVDKRAGEIACSLISEGYLLRWRYACGKHPRVVFVMRHARNENEIKVDVDEQLTRIWKNQKLVKSEPTPAPVVSI